MMENLKGKNREVKTLNEMLRKTVTDVKRIKNRNNNIRDKWEKVAGEAISSHTEIGMVKGGVLYINVDSATWLHHIVAFRKEQLLTSMQQEFKRGYISDIKFRVSTF